MNRLVVDGLKLQHTPNISPQNLTLIHCQIEHCAAAIRQ